MKTYLRLALLICLSACLPLLGSCEINGGGTPADNIGTAWNLCNHLWQAVYTADDGASVRHSVTFHPGGTGEEEIVYTYADGSVYPEYYRFSWQWASSSFTSIALYYGGGNVLYMDNVYIGPDYLSCLFEDRFLTFRGY